MYKVHRQRLRMSGLTLTDNVLSYFTDRAVAFTPARAFPVRAAAGGSPLGIVDTQDLTYDAWRRHKAVLALLLQELRQQVRCVYGREAGGTIAFVQSLEGERSITAVLHFHVFVINSSVRPPEHIVVASRCVTGNDSVSQGLDTVGVARDYVGR